MLACYINLDSRPDRRAFMEDQFAALGLEVERVTATTPETITSADIAPHSMADVLEQLSAVEVAVSVSHFRAWKHMLDHGQPYMLVLEDDLLLSSSLPSFLSAIGSAETTIGILRVETRLTEVKIHSRAEPGAPGFDFHLPLSFEAGSGAYIISAECAARILFSPLRFSLPMDDILFSLLSPLRDPTRLRVAIPALAVNRWEASPAFRVPEGILVSDVHPGRHMHKRRPPPKMPVGMPKIAREIRRLGRQVRGAYPAIRTYLAMRQTIIPLAEGELTEPPSAAPPRV